MGRRRSTDRSSVLAWALALSLTLGLLPAATARAGEDADPETFRTLDVGSGVVTLDVQDAPFGQVVEELIAPRTRVNIIVAPEAADQPVSLRVADLHWVQALDALTERIGGVMIRKARNLLRIERPEPVKMDFKDEEVKTVIQRIAEFAGANVIISEDISGKISLTLNGTPWRTALESVVKVAGFALVEQDYGTLMVLPRDRLELDADYYRFKYVRPPAPYKGVVSSSSGGGGGGGGSSGGGGGGGGGGGKGGGSGVVAGSPWIPSDDPKELSENFPIIAALRAIVEGDGGDVGYIPTQNTIVIRGTTPTVRKVKEMAEQLDIEPPQVFIDMNFVVTSNSDAINVGLDAGDSSGIGFGLGGSDILHRLPFNVGGTSRAVADLISGTPFPSPSSDSYGYGTLTTAQTQLLWNFLQRDQRTRIVQAPKLLALDNQEATIFIGESIRYARTTAATNQNGGLTFAVEEDGNSPVNVGFQLLVLPHVIQGEGKIRMTVIPLRRALTGTGPLPGFDRISVAGQTIDLPRVQSSELVSHMILRDGQTAVIGGLLEDRMVERADKVPFFGDLPLMGALFQGKEQTKVKEHLLITITPRILTGTDAASCTVSDELSFRSERVAAEYSDLYGQCCTSASGGPSATVTYVAPSSSGSEAGPIVIDGGASDQGSLPPPTVEPIPVAPGR
jgi:type II secretory pathway component GspD/PulD (secretin)